MSGRTKTVHERIAELRKLFLVDNVTIHKHTTAIDALVDALILLFDECNTAKLRRDKYIAAFIESYRETVASLRTLRLSKSDFEVIKKIGKGAFGDVQVVKSKLTKEVLAMKTLKKDEMLAQEETAFFSEERDIMAAADSRWITMLKYAFQDAENLYLVMEYHQGGDLLTLLAKHDDVFEEPMARFYLSELVLAIESLHAIGCVHRDIKPDNVLIDRLGHIKLVDFGSSARLDKNEMVTSRMAVGTPDYIAPEVLTSTDGNGKYGRECDWWSLGVVMYELLTGSTPFYAESLVAVYGKIMNCKDELTFPDDVEMSNDAQSLIKKLLVDRKIRLKFADIKAHPFFKSVDFDNLHTSTPPYVPIIKSMEDTSAFEDFEDDGAERIIPGAGGPGSGNFRGGSSSDGISGRQFPFIGFTYTRPLLQSEEGVYSMDKVHNRQSSANASSRISMSESSISLAEKAAVAAAAASSATSAADKELIAKLSSDNESLKDRLQTMEEMLTEKELEINSMNVSAARLQGQLDSSKTQLDETTKAKTKLEQTVVELEKNKAVQDLELKSLQKERKAAESESGNLETLRQRHAQELKDLQAKLETEIKSKEKAEARLAKIQGKIDEKKREKEAAAASGGSAAPAASGSLGSTNTLSPASAASPAAPSSPSSSSSNHNRNASTSSLNEVGKTDEEAKADQAAISRKVEELTALVAKNELLIADLHTQLEGEKERAKKSHKAKLELQKSKAVVDLELKSVQTQLDELTKQKITISKELDDLRVALENDRVEMVKMRGETKDEVARSALLSKRVAALEEERGSIVAEMEQLRVHGSAAEIQKLLDAKQQQAAVIDSLQQYIANVDRGGNAKLRKGQSSMELQATQSGSMTNLNAIPGSPNANDWRNKKEAKQQAQELRQLQYEVKLERTAKNELKEQLAELTARAQGLEAELEVVQQEAVKWKQQYADLVSDKVAKPTKSNMSPSTSDVGKNKDKDSKLKSSFKDKVTHLVNINRDAKNELNKRRPDSVAEGDRPINPLSLSSNNLLHAGSNSSGPSSPAHTTHNMDSHADAALLAAGRKMSTSSSSSTLVHSGGASTAAAAAAAGGSPMLDKTMRRQSMASGLSPAKEVHDPTKRVGHSIPHRFQPHFNVKSCKCTVCNKNVGLTRGSVKCSDCHAIFHAKCGESAPATCGISEDALRQIAAATALMQSREAAAAAPGTPERRTGGSGGGAASNAPPSPGDASHSSSGSRVSGWLKVPKPRGVRAGWIKKFILINEGEIMVFDKDPSGKEAPTSASNSDLSVDPSDDPIQTIDARVPGFTVQSEINASELIHAAGSDLPFIFKISNQKDSLLMLAPSIELKDEWITAFEGLAELWSASSETPKVVAHRVLYQPVDVGFSALCATTHEGRMLVGTEDGLFAFDDVTRHAGAKPPTEGKLIVDKPTLLQVEVLPEIRAMVFIADNYLHVLPLEMMDYGALMAKRVDHSATCYMFALGSHQGSHYLFAAMQKDIIIYKYNDSKSMFEKTIFEMDTSTPCTFVTFHEGRFLFGTDAFQAVSVQDLKTVTSLLDATDSTLAYLITGAKHAAVTTVGIIVLPKEYLLCYNDVAVFVSHNGRRSRQGELRWNASAMQVAMVKSLLFVFTSKGTQVRRLAEQGTSESPLLQTIDLADGRLIGHDSQRMLLSAVGVASCAAFASPNASPAPQRRGPPLAEVVSVFPIAQ
ncbi:Cdc42-binding protein kinase beta [Capsaspora owczarzaki ATCC 30864]|uniref:non-specific serine/threonine protein kinase n=1 Tax=Capsaspora owczarzaki (strain ATCC 30864) TaxID=595528 RepID=A0A0D2WWM9_CAPO3|nr:Cdc42-binding protein kinase beta [Capsaspora owczarzaki ATCC 30864]KJE96958.1 AGC/DMPK protein kinase [Capsaspora owczarzaki ATCC 30864]|eukprot:XP_004343922.1 Cdc42-binding protein kinase beta [Capsaspora owczarzaki ATCC 30864]